VEVAVAERARLEITITSEGEVKVKTHGLTGQECVEETSTLERLLGRLKSREKTADFYKQAAGTMATVRGRK